MPRQLVPIGEWLPDQPDFNNPGASTITNVVPRTENSYGPMASPVAFSGALSARCQGSFSFSDDSGDTHIYAGDATKLYELNSSSAIAAFTDVTRASGGAYATGALTGLSGFWSMTAFGNRIIACNFVDDTQTLLVGTDTQFSQLSSSAPKAQFCAVIKNFVMLGRTFDGTSGSQPRRLWWSEIDDPTSWPTPGTTAAVQVQSDYQDLEQSDLGWVMGLVGGGLAAADGAAFCERGIYRIAYAGSPAIFDFAIAEGASGTQAPMSIVQRRAATQSGIRGVAYYLGEDDFYAFDGQTSIPIGANKIAKTFFSDLDPAYLATVAGAADPINTLIFWAYSASGSGGNYNRLIVYNWSLDRWSLIDLTGSPLEWLTRSLTLGFTLDTLDSSGYTLDTLPFSLDSRVWTGGKPILSGFDSNHKLAYMTGANLAPIVETSEAQLFEKQGMRARVMNSRPIADGTGASISIGTRNLLSDSVTYGTAVAQNVIGDCPQRSNARYHRARLTMPAGSDFTHIQGVEFEAVPEGRR